MWRSRVRRDAKHESVMASRQKLSWLAMFPEHVFADFDALRRLLCEIDRVRWCLHGISGVITSILWYMCDTAVLTQRSLLSLQPL